MSIINSEKNTEGIIIKSIGGFYHVETPLGVLVCKARGIFRLNGISPAGGDMVDILMEKDSEPLIVKVYERKNWLVRPPLANLDGIVFVISACEPEPNTFILDKLISIAEYKNIKPLLVFTKIDLKSCEGLAEVYSSLGIDVCFVDNTTGQGSEYVKDFIFGKTTALIGNSGVGKSSLINKILPELNLDTNIISKKLGRGKHTTRQVELYKLSDGGYIADTPGFSTVDIEKYCRIPKDDIQKCFCEFSEFSEDCRFADCSHIKETGCSVRKAFEAGRIEKSRYESYVRMYEEAKKINEWE